MRKQHILYANNLEGDINTNTRDLYKYINIRKMTPILREEKTLALLKLKQNRQGN